MTQPAYIAISLTLIGISALLVWSHLSVRRRQPTDAQDETEQKYRTRQHRRRMWTSVMVGMLGASMLAGQLLDADQHPLAYLAYWSAMVLATLGVGLSAVIDMLATSQYAGIRRRQRKVELRRIEDDLKQYERRAHSTNNSETG